MTTYSPNQAFFAYEDKDGNLSTPLYDGRGPATKFLLDKLEDWENATKFSFEGDRWGSRRTEYEKAYKAWRKGIRDAAREKAKEYLLVSFRLVRNV